MPKRSEQSLFTDGSHLFAQHDGIFGKPAFARGQKNLARIDVSLVLATCNWNHDDYGTIRIDGVSAHHHDWAPPGLLRAQRGAQVRQEDVTASIRPADDGVNEPAKWSVTEISRKIGTLSAQGADVGDDFAVMAGRDGLFLFTGGEPEKVSNAFVLRGNLFDHE